MARLSRPKTQAYKAAFYLGWICDLRNSTDFTENSESTKALPAFSSKAALSAMGQGGES